MQTVIRTKVNPEYEPPFVLPEVKEIHRIAAWRNTFAILAVITFILTLLLAR